MTVFSILPWRKPTWRMVLVTSGVAVLSILLLEGLLRIPAVEEVFHRVPALSVPAALVLFLALVILGSRPMVNIVWRTRELESGELRNRLEALTRRAGLQLPGIRILTDRREANGFVVGLTDSTRCVVLTEHLIHSVPPAKVEAVFAHELGHVRRKHIPYLLLLMATYLFLSYPLLKVTWEYSLWMGLPALLAFTVLYWRVLFGIISRRFEVEADRAGAEWIGLDNYREALSSGRGSLGTSSRSFRHPSLEDRLKELDRCLENETGRTTSQFKSVVLRRRLAAMFFFSLLLFGAVLVGEIIRGAAG